MTGLSLKYLNEFTKLVLIRVRRDYHKELLSALPFVRALACETPGATAEEKNVQRPCFFNTIAVTGTIRS